MFSLIGLAVMPLSGSRTFNGSLLPLAVQFQITFHKNFSLYSKSRHLVLLNSY